MPDPARTTAYLLCATPRSGSTLLCELLRSTGVAGVPESYFREPDEERWVDRWRLPRQADGSFSYADYVRAAACEGSTANGVFGARVMWGSLQPVVDRLRAADPSSGSGDLDLLSRAFGRLRFVHLRREDTVAQAVSWARAEQTGFWHPQEALTDHRGTDGCGTDRSGAGGTRGPTTPRFDLPLVRHLVGTIADHERRWGDWFSAVGVRPWQVTYEQVAADPVGVTTRILEVLGLRLPPGQGVRARAERQGDALNDEWIRRYRAAPPIG